MVAVEGQCAAATLGAVVSMWTLEVASERERERNIEREREIERDFTANLPGAMWSAAR